MQALIAVAVFVAAALLDYAAARYQQAVHGRRRYAAGIWSCVMCLLSSVNVWAFVHEPWLIAVECADE